MIVFSKKEKKKKKKTYDCNFIIYINKDFANVRLKGTQ